MAIDVYTPPPAIYLPIEATSTRCAKNSRPGQHDPLERINRRVYGLNEILDRVIFRPVAMTYRRVLPRPVRRGLHNMAVNIGEPNVAVNDLLQGRLKPAGVSTVRFAANTIFGIAGIFDVAGKSGLKRHDNDFGLTLGRMHIGAGPYLYLPFLGPDSIRDLAGEGIDFVLDPLNFAQSSAVNAAETGAMAVTALHNRSELDGELKMVRITASDPYATIRSFYLQSRESAVRDGAVDIDALPDFPDEEPAIPPDPSLDATPPVPVTSSEPSAPIASLEGAPLAVPATQ